MADLRFCRDCRHCRLPDGIILAAEARFLTARCDAPQVRPEPAMIPDLVSGIARDRRPLCQAMRAKSAACGPAGLLFEPKSKEAAA